MIKVTIMKRRIKGETLKALSLSALFIFLFFFNLNFISAEEFGYNYLEPGKNLNKETFINYTEVNVNNSNFWEGYSVATLYTYYKGLFDSVYCKLTGCTMQGDIDMDGNTIDNAIFEGTYNWTSGDNYNIFDGSTLTFNESKLSTQFFNVSTIQIITGTPQGSLGDIQTYNNVPYNVSEVDSDLEMIVNFTNIVDFNQLIIRYRSEQEDEPHTMQVQIWDYVDSDWGDYGELPASTTYHILEFGIYDSDEHIQNGVVQVRFYQLEGPPNKVHLHNFDWVTIAKGLGTPAGEEVDPHSVYTDGSKELTGNWDMGAYNLTNTGTRHQIMPNFWTCQLTSTSDPVLTSNLTKSIADGDC